jgi:phosphoglycerol transferase MdoB-like AlkP superfamily enzyme
MLLKKIRSVPWGRVAAASARFIWMRLHILAVPFLLVLMLECLSRISFVLTYEWIIELPDEFALNVWLAFFLTLLAAAAIGRTRYTYGLLFLAFGVTGLVSGIKMNLTGTPLFIWDVLLPSAGKDPVRSLNPALTANLLWAAAAAAGASILILLFRNVRLHMKERMVYGSAALFLLSSVYWSTPIDFRDFFGIYPIRYEQERNYARNGFLVAVLDGIDFVLPEKPNGSGSRSIRRLVRSLGATGEIGTDASPADSSGSAPSLSEGKSDKPNVIVLLSETFWDPTLLPNVTFSEDPLPFFRSLMQSSTGGWMLTPQFGGTTANVEFEVLTGNSVRFLPDNSIAYINYVNRDVDSLAGIFARQGYTTTAINPYFNWFFNSRNAYRNMGFSRFISSEFFEPRFHGPNYEDKQVMEKIIQTTAATSGPDFVFANTMENHGGYEDKFYSNPIKVSGSITAKSKNMLENYATGEQAFDRAFQSLVEHYARSDEPTVILCFGDHLPGLGSSYFAYKDAGYITDDGDPDFMEKMHYTPFVIWDNTGGRPKETLKMNASYLGAYLLHYTGRQGTYYTDFLYDLYTKQPLIPIRPFRNKHPIDESVLADYQRLQYDILFGSQEGYKTAGIEGLIVPNSFQLGYGSPVLEGATVDKNGRLELFGNKFNSECTVWLNGSKLRTTGWDDAKLIAWLPEGEEPPSLPWSLQVRLTDRKNTVITESGKLVLKERPDSETDGASAP